MSTTSPATSADRSGADFNDAGEVRSLSADGPRDFSRRAFSGNAVGLRDQVHQRAETKKALGLRYATLVAGETVEYECFTRVEFKQVANVQRHGFGDSRSRWLRARRSSTRRASIIQVNSTVRRGSKPTSLGKIITQEQAIALAKAKFGVEHCDAAKCTLVLSSHEGSMDPVYEVTSLVVRTPQGHALPGEGQDQRGRLHREQAALLRQKSPAAGQAGKPGARGIAANSFPRIPEYREKSRSPSRSGRSSSTRRSCLTPMLANQRYKMLVLDKGKWVTVKANAQGTFEFDPLSKDELEVSKFSAAVTFVWLNTQDATLESWGAVKVPNPIPVYMDDRDSQGQRLLRSDPGGRFTWAWGAA